MLIFSAILWGVAVVYQERQDRYCHQAEQELYAINYLQTQGVVDWREQRLTDAAALLDDTLLAQTIASWLQNHLDAQQVLVQERLRILQERQKYTAVYLVDAQGHLQLGPADTAAGVLPAPEQQALQHAFSQALVSVVEPRHDPFFAFPFFSLIAPIFDGAQPMGAIWLVSDVRTTLYPRLQAWPTPRTTAESILFSRSGNQAQALNPLRHPLDSTTVFKIPADGVESLQQADFIGQAMLGVRGIFYGSDYREQEVLAMTSAVPESPWMVVSKIDVAEAFADTQMREVLALSLPVSLCLLLAGLVFAYVQRRAWLRERALKIELQRHMGWLEGAQKAASIGYFAFDLIETKFAMSSMAREIFGLPDGIEIGLKEWATLVLPDERQKVLEVHRHAMSSGTALRAQYRIQRMSDQAMRWVEVWGEYEAPAEKSGPVRMIGTIQDITERKQSEEELANYRTVLEEKVRLDPMTQIPNRRALDEHMALEWQRAMRSKTTLSLMMIDVDHFKAYNDHYGHVAGDVCLQKVAKAIAESVTRAGELAARYGGEEFSVLLPHADTAQAMVVAERVRAAVAGLALEHAQSSVQPYVTVSIGLVCAVPAFTESAERWAVDLPPPRSHRHSVTCTQTLFEQADTALYHAKQQGRNRVMVYPPTRNDGGN
ncbi:MAG: diguanylate cyclase [Burkholderiaceae bacterium]|nr:diguanylate cyclase [Burkholderiaceae bacterium]